MTQTIPSPRNLKTRRMMMIATLYLFLFIFGILSGIRSVILPLMKDEFQAGYDAQGFLMSLQYIGGMGLSLFATYMFQKFKAKFIMISTIVMLMLGAWLSSWSPTFMIAAIAYTLVNSGPSMFEPGKTDVISIVFTKNVATNIAMIHSFFGIGSMIGPKLAELLMTSFHLNWHQLYDVMMIPLALIFLFILCTKYTLPASAQQQDTTPADSAQPVEQEVKRLTMGQAFKTPIVWLFALVSASMGAVDGGFNNWVTLYFQDVFQLDPITFGATFMSIFYLIFTATRIFSGLWIERIGYMRWLKIAGFGTAGVLLTSFICGRKGVWILILCAITIATFWPTFLSTCIKQFDRDCAIISSVGAIIAAPIGALVQQLIGYTNQFLGSAWGIRSIVIYALLMVVVLVVFEKQMKHYVPVSQRKDYR